MTNFNERTNTLLYKNISLTLYSRKGWCWLCVRGEFETGTDCYILTPSSSNHRCTFFAFWLGCWVTEGPGPLSGAGSYSTGILSPKAVSGTRIYFCLTFTCFLWAYASATITEFNHVHWSRCYSDIFDRMHLFGCSSAYLHRCISWLTARSRVTMLH